MARGQSRDNPTVDPAHAHIDHGIIPHSGGCVFGDRGLIRCACGVGWGTAICCGGLEHRCGVGTESGQDCQNAGGPGMVGPRGERGGGCNQHCGWQGKGEGESKMSPCPLLLLIAAAACVHGSDGEGWSLHVGDGVSWRECGVVTSPLCVTSESF